MSPRFNRVMDLFVAVVFCSMLVLPTALAPFVGGSGGFASQVEQRAAAVWPGLPGTWPDFIAFPHRFEAWLVDHFGLRRQLIHAHSRILYSVFRTSPTPKVVLGREGWLFLKGDPKVDGEPISDFRGTHPLTPYELERWRWQLQDQHDWVASRGMVFRLAIIGGKESVHAEKLPSSIRSVGLPTAREQFLGYLRPRLSFPVIDLTPALVAAKASREVYRPTDTHWNDHGALAGVRGLVFALQQDFPSLRPPGEADMAAKVTYRRDGDLARLMGLQDIVGESFVELRPKAPRAVITLVPGSRLLDSIAKIADTNLPRALFFHDSFGPTAKPFLSECFEEIRFTWSNFGLETKKFKDFEPDLVIQMMGERRIRLSQDLLPPVQQESNERYFKAAASVLASWTTPQELAGLAPASPAAKASPGGLVVTAGGAATELILPEIERTDTMLPILRVELAADVRTDLALTWSTRHPDRWPPVHKREVVAKVAPGGARVYLPLLDPEAVGPLRLEFRRLSGDCVVKSIEVRGVPRDVPPAAVAPSGSR